MSDPKYINGGETALPRSMLTPEEINHRNREFWKPRPPTDQDESAHTANGFLQGHKQGRKDAEDERERLDRGRRATGTSRSADVRRAATVERDRRIHDAKTSGKKPKQIASDRAVMGPLSDKELADQTKGAARLKLVYRVLRSPRP